MGPKVPNLRKSKKEYYKILAKWLFLIYYLLLFEEEMNKA